MDRPDNNQVVSHPQKSQPVFGVIIGDDTNPLKVFTIRICQVRAIRGVYHLGAYPVLPSVGKNFFLHGGKCPMGCITYGKDTGLGYQAKDQVFGGTCRKTVNQDGHGDMPQTSLIWLGKVINHGREIGMFRTVP